MLLDYRKEVKEILTGPNPKKIGVQIPMQLNDEIGEKFYHDVYNALQFHNAGKASVQTTTELTASEKIDLHDYLMTTDKHYANLV
jgi:hypothetical protein